MRARGSLSDAAAAKQRGYDAFDPDSMSDVHTSLPDNDPINSS